MSAESESGPLDETQLFERLFMDYCDPLCRFVQAYVGSWEAAKDLVDDVFLQLWRRRESLDYDRGLKTYLFTAAKNHAISYLRREEVESRHRGQYLIQEKGATEPEISALAEQQIMAAELTAAIQCAVDALPPRQREVILLKWERQATHEEIARVLNIAPKTVAEHFRRALEQLRRSLPRDIGSRFSIYD